MSKKNGKPTAGTGICSVCQERRAVGICNFGRGRMKAGPHCRGCCSNPVRDHWRPMASRAKTKEKLVTS